MDSFVTFLERASIELLQAFQATVQKASANITEVRDVARPTLVTEMLMSLLEALGGPHGISPLRKRVRDDVNFSDAKLPWRRHPYWLVLRVAAQRSLCLSLGATQGQICYKLILAVVHSDLLNKVSGHLAPQRVHLLKAKLCRRMAKLDAMVAAATNVDDAAAITTRATSTNGTETSIRDALANANEDILASVQNAGSMIDTVWSQFKRANLRPVPRLSPSVDHAYTTLALCNSWAYLDEILRTPRAPNPTYHTGPCTDGIQLLSEPQKLYGQSMKLSRLDGKARDPARSAPGMASTPAHCLDLAAAIIDYVNKVVGKYLANPDSEVISVALLNTFDLWVEADKAVIQLCPGLVEYPPAFSAHLLNCLILPRLVDMQRLQDIQTYLADRYNEATQRNTTIFSNAGRDSYAVHYYDRSSPLQTLHQEIKRDEKAARERKTDEWNRVWTKYLNLTELFDSGICKCSIDRETGQRNIRGCAKCYHGRQRKKLKIDVHEDFLPAEITASKIVVFEIGMPEYLRRYRDATWLILRDLTHPSPISAKQEPMQVTLHDYRQLKPYASSPCGRFTLASSKKSHLGSHYNVNHAGASLESALRATGCSWSYFDTKSSSWLGKFPNESSAPTLQHLCGVHIPDHLQNVVIRPSHPPTFGVPNLSSYNIQANRARTPAQLPVHEFSALQKLLGSEKLRWLDILVEMASSNLNFSSLDTTQLLSDLVNQVGPGPSTSDVRDWHGALFEEGFATRMLFEIDSRLTSIATNRGELHCLELMINLLLRMASIMSDHVPGNIWHLIMRAQNIAIEWTHHFREEYETAKDVASAERAAANSAWVALLCRKLFWPIAEGKTRFGQESLSVWIQAAICFQEGLANEVKSLGHVVKRLLLRDAQLAQQLAGELEAAIQLYPDGIGAAFNALNISTVPSRTTQTPVLNFGPWKTLPAPNQEWLWSTAQREGAGSSSDQYLLHPLIGRLLVNGKAIGKLPQEILDSAVINDLFSDRHLLAFPSNLPGMTHRLSRPIDGNFIHFGTRHGKHVIRCESERGLFEFIPSAIFKASDGAFDIPEELLNCIHWLNLDTGDLECRRKPVIWRKRQRDWVISVKSRRATRGNRDKYTTLVCPASKLFDKVAGLFRYFEMPGRITVFASEKGKLHITLRDLELSFRVNYRGMLQCEELKSEIDPNQDIGTLHGFKSKLVLRHTVTGKRSVLIPLDQPTYERHGIHVFVYSTGVTGYGNFEVDDVLGRISSPPEPRLLFTKTLLHALTSFPIPDSLTGRTGSEEAFALLTSASAQPWTPLAPGVIEIVERIRKLAPIREYYPKDRKAMQTIRWNPKLPIFIQHDAFDELAQKILAKSSSISAFANCDESLLDAAHIDHLRSRASIQSLLRARENSVTRHLLDGSTFDVIYESRDKETGTDNSSVIFDIVRGLENGIPKAVFPQDYHSVLTRWPLIGGIGDNSEILGASLASLLVNSLAEHWFGFVDLVAGSEKYELAFILGTLIYHKEANEQILRLLSCYNQLAPLKDLDIPEYPSFNKYHEHGPPSTSELVRTVSDCFKPFIPDLQHNKKAREAARRQHIHRCEAQARNCADRLIAQWPIQDPTFGDSAADLIDCDAALNAIKPDWQRRLRNSELKLYVEKAQSILELHRGPRSSRYPANSVSVDPVFGSTGLSGLSISPVTLIELAAASNFDLTSLANVIDFDGLLAGSTCAIEVAGLAQAHELSLLKQLLRNFSKTSNVLRKIYGEDLLRSLVALEARSQSGLLKGAGPGFLELVTTVLSNANNLTDSIATAIRDALVRDPAKALWLKHGVLWPSESTTSLLGLLAFSQRSTISESCREGIIRFGRSITQTQRLKRMCHAAMKYEEPMINAEINNRGHINWDPSEYPDWLLIEIDANIMIREEQVEVAHAIIHPSSNRNSVLQLNMGKGKTSCIVPMALSILADGASLSRIIVPRALIFQTAQLLQSRLSGLCGREVNCLTFSRRTPSTSAMLNYYRDEHNRAFGSGGIMLTSPENLLSFQLSGWQRLSDGKDAVAHKLLEIQNLLNDNARDVIDESDFTLGVKTQLIYPSGAQTTVDGNPWRWEVAEKLLELVEEHLETVRRLHTKSVLVVGRGEGFPIINFLREEPQDLLRNMIIDDIAHGRTTIVNFAAKLKGDQSRAMTEVLTSDRLDSKLFNRVLQLTTDRSSAFNSLLTARGLLNNGVIFLCLRKRWLVQYGTDLGRCPLAIPFEAKGVPSERAEFGHPDVAIVLTCLSFYYQGLDIDQFRESLQRVLRADDPAAEYERWSGSAHLPSSLNQWNLINLDDHLQTKMLHEKLRLHRPVINHYLNQFVFPLHAKQFEVKLQASAFDLPLLDRNVDKEGWTERTRSSGFSGTCDNRIVLPTTIKQDDLPSLAHTNAEVLCNLLHLRNSSYEVAGDEHSGQFTRHDEKGFLHMIKDRGLRILIDAGAFVLELDNKSLVEEWLKIDTGAKAGLFFTADHRVMVMYRGKSGYVPLATTPFAEDLSECLVYLDESHTRGVDLKLPAYAIGALTLALGQTKDHTVQAAMRLRQLATTQSVAFFAPPDVHQSIMDLCKPAKKKITSYHVVAWLLEQTCRSNEDILGLHLSQGVDFCLRKDAEWQYEGFKSDAALRLTTIDKLRQPESRTLAQLYGNEVSASDSAPQRSKIRSAFLRKHYEDITSRRNQTTRKGFSEDVLQEVEQEREIEFQAEEIREIQKRFAYPAFKFPGLDDALLEFATTGQLQDQCKFQTIFAMLSESVAGRKYGIRSTAPTSLYVSEEFTRSVETRPVEWILYAPQSGKAIVIIPEEAELLLDIIREAQTPRTNLICYASPVTKSMLPFSTLNYYAIPSLPPGHCPPTRLAIEVGILGGRMYFTVEELGALKDYLTIPEEGEAERAKGERKGFSANQTGFLLEWCALRRKTRDILHSPMGYVCLGKPLTAEHPFFRKGA